MVANSLKGYTSIEFEVDDETTRLRGGLSVDHVMRFVQRSLTSGLCPSCPIRTEDPRGDRFIVDIKDEEEVLFVKEHIRALTITVGGRYVGFKIVGDVPEAA